MVASCWAAAVAIGVGVAYGAGIGAAVINDVSEYTSEAKNVVYGSFHRLAWGVALGWLVWASVKGYGGGVSTSYAL